MGNGGTAAFRDVVVASVGAAVALAAAFYFDVFENFERRAGPHEAWELDEFVVVPPVPALVLGFFSSRRWRKYRSRGLRTRARGSQGQKNFGRSEEDG